MDQLTIWLQRAYENQLMMLNSAETKDVGTHQLVEGKLRALLLSKQHLVKEWDSPLDETGESRSDRCRAMVSSL